jgi:hypothetical protein
MSMQAFIMRSEQAGDPRAEQAEKDGGGQGDEHLPAEQLEPQIARQPAEAQALQQRREPADEYQREEDDDDPSNHG